MDEALVARIRDFAPSHSRSAISPPASSEAVGEAERELGFPLPALLKACYLEVGNGGFGPAYGILGLRGGYVSDCGTLVEFYRDLRDRQEPEGKRWKAGLLPFCEWGCGMFSCVDCQDASHPVCLYEYPYISPQDCTLPEFFERWMAGLEIHTHRGQLVEHWITNPFTGRKTRVFGWRRE
jgi:hypothetical protein